MPKRRERLLETLEALHEELEASEELAPTQREELRRTAREIQARLAGEERAGEELAEDDGFGRRAQELAARFEGSHPRLAETLHRIALGLAELGI